MKRRTQMQKPFNVILVKMNSEQKERVGHGHVNKRLFIDNCISEQKHKQNNSPNVMK